MRKWADIATNSSTGRGPDVVIAGLAAPQQTMVARWQLLSAGITPGAIKYRLKIGRLHHTDYDGVYSVGAPNRDPRARARAAVLAAGPGAVLSHGSAGVLWGIYSQWRYPLETTAQSRREHRNLRVHHSKLPPEDRDVQYGIPVTSAARTVYDLAARLSDKQRARVIPDLRRRRYLNLDDLIALLDRHPHTHSTKLLRPLVQHPDRNPTRSPLEDKFLALIDQHGLPVPLVNVPVLGFEIDMYFPEHRLAVELDGYSFHRDLAQFKTDRKRDATLLTHGIATLRITADRLDDEPDEEADRLGEILDRRAP